MRKLPEALSLTLHYLAISYSQLGLVDRLLGPEMHTVATVDDIYIALCHGETMGRAGVSEAGNSTILKSISSLRPPLRGEIRLKDHEKLPAKVEDRDAKHLRQVQLIF